MFVHHSSPEGSACSSTLAMRIFVHVNSPMPASGITTGGRATLTVLMEGRAASWCTAILRRGPRADPHSGSRADDRGPGRLCLKPATRRRLGADTEKYRASRSDGRCHSCPARSRARALQHNGPAMVQRLEIAPARILHTVRSHTAGLPPGRLRCQSPAAAPGRSPIVIPAALRHRSNCLHRGSVIFLAPVCWSSGQR